MKTLPKGTTLHCTAHFDNSEHNLANPDPDETVRWGDQTWEEMMIGWYDMAVPAIPRSPTCCHSRAAVHPRPPATRRRRGMTRRLPRPPYARQATSRVMPFNRLRRAVARSPRGKPRL